MKTVHDKSFKTYGRVLNLDLKEFLQVLRARSVTAAGTGAYEPSLDSLEELPLFRTLQEEVYGGLPMELAVLNVRCCFIGYQCVTPTSIAI